MKNLLIIYNVIFLLFGNVLFTSIHYLHDHDQHHEYNNDECQECIIIENSNNYVSDFQEVNFSNNNFNEFAVLYLAVIQFNINNSYPARSPPSS